MDLSIRGTRSLDTIRGIGSPEYIYIFIRALLSLLNDNNIYYFIVFILFSLEMYLKYV